jgi:hypothetical protein
MMYYIYIYIYYIIIYDPSPCNGCCISQSHLCRRRDDSSRLLRTTLGSFLCSALRDELEVDCVLFDGGNIRGADLASDRPQSVRPVQMMYIKYVIHIYIG